MTESFSLVDDWLARAVRRVAGNPNLAINLDTRTGAISGPAILYNDRAALFWSALRGESGFCEAFAAGRVRVQGDLVQVLEEIYRSWRSTGASWTERALQEVRQLLQRNSLTGSRRNIHRHYDIGTDFYQLWLDRELLYTCAYYEESGMTLEEAQQAKMDLVCRKVGLRSEDRVVEAGCGWGTLAIHMARRYGAIVRAFNISGDQIEYARRRVRDEGLSGRVEFVEDDYRNISGKYDVFMSVGMLEHVGADHYQELGQIIHRSLGDRGRGLLHFIGRDHPAPLSSWINERIFPGAYAPSLAEALPLLEQFEYAVLDVENLRPHYARTVRHWLERYEAAFPQVVEKFGEEFARAWQLYLAGSIAAFETRTLQLFQVVFAGREFERVPWTRKALYAPLVEARCAAATS
jgi:cyclopropane-fatty-acyl-phospholipid synthase